MCTHNTVSFWQLHNIYCNKSYSDYILDNICKILLKLLDLKWAALTNYVKAHAPAKCIHKISFYDWCNIKVLTCLSFSFLCFPWTNRLFTNIQELQTINQKTNNEPHAVLPEMLVCQANRSIHFDEVLLI